MTSPALPARDLPASDLPAPPPAARPDQAAPSGRGEVVGGLLFHLMVVAAIVACQVAATPSRILNADNTWHFRLARDVMTGAGVYWAAVDANRLFPDLIVGMAAYALPGGDDFVLWKVYFYVLFVLLLYLSLWLLTAVLYERARDRRAFVLCSVAAFLLLALLTPFWDRWLLDPGNHGTALPACFAAMAVLLWMNRTGRLGAGLILLFIGVAALTVAANRYLLIAFLAPLGGAIFLVWLAALAGARRSGPGARRAGLLFVLAVVVGVAALWGLVAWQIVSDLSWHQLTMRGGIPALPESDHLAWLETRWGRLAQGIVESLKLFWDVAVGLALLVAAIPVAAALLVRALFRGRLSPFEENRLVLAELAGLAALASLAFLLVQADNAEPFQFRFLAVPVALAVVALACLPVPLTPRLGRLGAPAAALVLAGLTAATVATSAEQQVAVLREEAYIQRAVRELETKLQAYAPPGETKLRGFSEYWLANDLTVRSKILQIETLEPDRELQYRFFNNNAAHLCNADFFYVLQDARKDEPRGAHIVGKLGPPLHLETVDLARYPKVSLYIYDRRHLQERLVGEARQAAARVFPDFRCGPPPAPAKP